MVKGGHIRSTTGTQANAQTQKVLQVARKLAATIGADFFEATAKHLAKAIEADCVLIGEFAGGQMERVRTLACWMDGQTAARDFELAGSASAPLLFGKSIQCRSDAQGRFPDDILLAQVKAQAVLGVPLLDPPGRPIGLMLALYRRAVTRVGGPRQLLEIFSARAAAELSRKKQEDELRESEQRYRAFICRSTDAMWRMEFEHPIDTSLSAKEQLDEIYRLGYVAECNHALAQLLGFENCEQLLGSRLEDLLPRSEVHEEAHLKAIQNGYDFTTVEVTRVDRFGRPRHLLRTHWGIVEDGMLARIWGTTRDITDLKLSEQELGASERRMSRLLETMKLVVVIEDPDGAISYCNRYFCSQTGWTAAAVKGKTWMEMLAPAEDRERLEAIFAEARNKPEAPVHFESTLLGPDGQHWHFDWDRTVLRDAGGRVAAWATIGRDVTAHKALEEQLRQAQKLATIGKLAGGVAHDFNNLLTVILGYSAHLLESPERLNPVAHTALDEIQKAASKGAELTHRLLAFGRRQILRPEILSLNLLISDSAQMLRALIGEDVHLTTVLDPSIGLIRIDSASFHQVLMNLAVNARDAMPEGGTLLISTSNVVIEATDRDKLIAPGEYVQVTVSDSGTGMSDEVRNHLFEPFFTTKAQGKGTGLGLSMVYGIVQQSGGTIAVQSAPGQGTTFRLSFPRVMGEAKCDGKTDRKVETRRGAETILLVEDREDVRELTAHTLREYGYTVLDAESPARALELGLDRGRTIHLLLTDVVLPQINGFDLASRIRTCHGGIKVLFMSGYADPARVAERITEPGCAYLQKPFDPHMLAVAVRELLDH